ncbi:hypothetical protein [Eggerthella sinensis]|uniref:hypothetical protein n=1 Tax=Eggerthella sinensis TaxID=242230 RepID=UPI0022E79E76|nr:hypothetical protein [Eggerthella sinensis]
MLAFARAPRLLLLDEPYGPLDPDAAVVLSELIDEARAAAPRVGELPSRRAEPAARSVAAPRRRPALAARRTGRGLTPCAM